MKKSSTDANLLDWLIDNIHLISVNYDAAFCEKQQKPSAAFRSIEVSQGRPWNIKGMSRKRLIKALKKEMEANKQLK